MAFLDRFRYHQKIVVSNFDNTLEFELNQVSITYYRLFYSKTCVLIQIGEWDFADVYRCKKVKSLDLVLIRNMVLKELSLAKDAGLKIKDLTMGVDHFDPKNYDGLLVGKPTLINTNYEI